MRAAPSRTRPPEQRRAFAVGGERRPLLDAQAGQHPQHDRVLGLRRLLLDHLGQEPEVVHVVHGQRLPGPREGVDVPARRRGRGRARG